ncbi:hypothetical protein RFEPED_1315 [Rickettsia felis str. Pedreira]|uniref:Uncharacterized protein n=1 Tax=Rickettsia felis str. Pedreira TaxID=1359196 RepID=A0A0F3MT50_RICFI|nr:hypothetical protein RFEPED_1315 [Rickettsia felis str. Pedreira]
MDNFTFFQKVKRDHVIARSEATWQSSIFLLFHEIAAQPTAARNDVMISATFSTNSVVTSLDFQ